MLHIVNKSPTERNSVETCLEHAKKGSKVLLIEDAVYAATRGGAAEAKVKSAMADVAIYVLQPDLAARGMADRLIEGVNLVDYGGFVDLVAEQPNCQSWL
jgi:tRNA 2-thiouridine synthesizing protein B